MNDKCNCYRFSPRDSLSGAVAQIADYLSKHPGWNETELRNFVDGLIIATGVESFNGRTGTVTLDKNDVNNLKIASAYFAEEGESIDSIDLVSLYNNGVRFVFTDFNNETNSYNLSFVLDHPIGSDNVVYYPIASGNVISVNGKNGEVELKVVDVSNGNSPDKNAYIFIDESEDYPDIVATDSNKLGGQKPSYYATAEDVDNISPDDSVIDGKPWTSKKTVDALCLPFEASGNTVQVYPVEGYPLGVKASWEPEQAGSGDPSPENIRPINGRYSVTVVRCGGNLLNITPFNKVEKNGITYEYVPDGGIHLYGTATANSDSPTFPLWLPPGKYFGLEFVSGFYPNVVVVRNGKNIWLNTKSTFEILAGDVTKYWYFVVNAGTTVDRTVYPYIVTGTARPTTYEPYTGSTIDIALPETVYGGTLDVETGVVKVDYKAITLPGDYTYKTDGLGDYYIEITDKKLGINTAICESYVVNTYSTSRRVLFTGSGTLYPTIEDFENALNANQPILVYKLEMPYTIQLTQQQIAALSGVNTLYTDANSVVVTGAEDPKHTISELKNAIISLGGNV